MPKRAGPFHIYIVALTTALVLSFLPTRLLGWTAELSSVVAMPTVPFGDVGTSLRVWLQPSPVERSAADDPEADLLRQQMDEYRVMWQGAQREAERLQDQIEQLERARRFDPGVPSITLTASIVGRDTQGSGESYRLNVGSSRQDMVPGAVAVYHGSDLVGRVASVSRITSTLIPATDPAIGLLEAMVVPADPDDPRHDRTKPRTLLIATGDGTFTGDLENTAGVRIGDFVHLDDDAWPRTARSLIIGLVTAIEEKEESPLRLTMTVTPRYTASGVASVTIKLEAPAEGAEK